MQHAELEMFRNLHHPRPMAAKEFEPRPLRDISPFTASLVAARNAVGQTRAEIAVIDDKLARADADLRPFQARQNQLREAEEERRLADAARYLNGETEAAEAAAKSVAHLRRQVLADGPRRQAIDDAVVVLRKNRAKLDAKLPAKLALLSSERRAWLFIRRDHEFEQLRSELHSIQATLARALAVERHFDFNGGNATADFVGAALRAFGRNSSFQPDWVGRDVADFPGYADACDALANELENMNGNEDA